MFEKGIKDLNSLLVSRFNCEFCNLDRYSSYFRFVVWSKNSPEMGRVLGVTKMIQDALSKKLEFSVIIRMVKEIMGHEESVSDKELFQDLDFKTGINRWYYHNKERIQLSLLIIPIVVSFVALMLQFF